MRPINQSSFILTAQWYMWYRVRPTLETLGRTKSRDFILLNLEYTDLGTQEALKNVAVKRE